MSTSESPYKPVQFLIVDDDEISVMAIKRAMQQLNLANQTQVAHDGVEALELLRASVVGGVLPPSIITLDLSMPRMGGLEFLEVVRSDPVFKKLVVFVLTTSESPSDVASAYEKNIAGYIVKENPTESLRDALSMLREYSQLVVLPS